MKCGRTLRYQEEEYCNNCQKESLAFERGVALWPHLPPVSTSIYYFKFHNQRNFATYYAKEAVKVFAGIFLQWKIDLILPIPLHKERMRKRGFNQSELLAKELYLGLKEVLPVEFGALSFSSELLLRKKKTRPQKELDPKGRRRNIEHAFSVEESCQKRLGTLAGKRILLVDDIYTTGATLSEAAWELRRSGAEKVFYFTLSIGQ